MHWSVTLSVAAAALTGEGFILFPLVQRSMIAPLRYTTYSFARWAAGFILFPPPLRCGIVSAALRQRASTSLTLSLRSRVKGSLRSRLLNSLRSLFFSSLRSRCLSLWLGLTASPGLRALRSSQAPRYARHPSGPTGPPGYRRGPPDPAGRETLYYILIRARPVCSV